ncbi:phosphoglucomutase [Thermodesulfobacteriota bacterium]
MDNAQIISDLHAQYIRRGNHAESDYFSAIKALVEKRNLTNTEEEYHFWQQEIEIVYSLIEEELITNENQPVSPIKFGTSGWRGMIGKDLYAKSVMQVTLAIVSLYEDLETNAEHAPLLGVSSLAEARERGCVLGFDNRFGGQLLASKVTDVLTAKGFVVHYAGESTTGCLSAAVLELRAAFSINLTPSHNPLEYAGFKYNAADAGPAAPALTDRITTRARSLVSNNESLSFTPDITLIKTINALGCWIDLVRRNKSRHGLDYDSIIDRFTDNNNLVVAIDCVHGASRGDISSLFKQSSSDRLLLFRADYDPTFGGVAPEPSTKNLETVMEGLALRSEPLKLGMIIDPDGDRIRFTDGTNEFSMNQFGAMAFHYLHTSKHKQGIIAKSVATSNFANAIAAGLDEEVFEPAVGFKEFKPVVDKALVCFEESDGITVIGHTPEKDAYIGLLLALDMVLTLGKSLSEYRHEIQEAFGYYYPDSDSVSVNLKGDALLEILSGLKQYQAGSTVTIGEEVKTIVEVIDIDGRKMILEDGSWIMIRPSGTEPKVRFYVESRTDQGREMLFDAARNLLKEIGLSD